MLARVSFLVLALFVTGAAAADFEAAVTAYEAGRYAEAFPVFVTLAKKEDAVAQNYLGLMYAKGQGVTRNDATAAYWFRSAAQWGHEKAQRNLAFLIANGRVKPLPNEIPECR